ncbi:MAG: glycosyltransferase family 4 protein [Bacteroidales bacterium]
MKILMLLDNKFPPDPRIENEAKSLTSIGHELHILCYNYGGMKKYEVNNNVNIHRFYIPLQLAKKSLALIHIFPIYKIIWKYQVRKFLKGNNMDAIHIHDLALCFLTNYIKKNYTVKLICDMHENYPYLIADQIYMRKFPWKYILSKKIWFKKEKQWLSHADQIICVAKEMSDRLSNILIEKHKFVIVPNTLNLSLFSSNQKELPELKNRFCDSFNLFYFGGIDPVRGIEILIEAGNILKNKINNIKIIIVGDGKILPELKNLVQSLNLENTIIFEGWVSPSYIKSYMNICDIGIIPHLRSEQTDNSSPNKLFQYMYFGMPIISSNCKSIEKIIKQEECGLIYEDTNSKDLADKVLFYFQNRDLMNLTGEKGHNAVLNKYNWEATHFGLLEIYK